MSWSVWDVVLFCLFAGVATASLVRLMQRRRDQLVGEVEAQLAEVRRQKEKAAKQKKKQRAA
jgi:hypothetical protein